MFQPQHGGALYGYIAAAIVVGVIVLIGLSFTPNKLRRPLIVAVTFLAGLFYALEFFLPFAKTDEGEVNFLTPWNKPFSDITTVLQSFAIGLGVYSLVGLHLKNIARQRAGWGNSVALIVSAIVMTVAHIGKASAPDNQTLKMVDKFVYDGMLKSLDATMFSIIAFYIVSAAYRAFRIRSLEATIMLVSAGVIMLGQVAIGQALTNWVPNEGFSANFRFENLSSWILVKVNTPAIMAINFGLGVGALATALRLWLSLERGSYFEEEL